MTKGCYLFVQQGGWISSPSKKFLPQLHMASSTGMMLLPNGVSEYMVLGGLSGMTSRCIIPHSSRSCNCCDSIFGVAFGIMRCSSIQCSGFSIRYQSMSGLYFPPIMKSVASTGQLNWSFEYSIVCIQSFLITTLLESIYPKSAFLRKNLVLLKFMITVN